MKRHFKSISGSILVGNNAFADGPQIAEQRVFPAGTRRDKKRTPKTALFLAPVPLPWLEAAAALPGKALYVGLIVWFYTGPRPGQDAVLSPTTLARFRVPRETGRRALAALEDAGLVTVSRMPSKSPRVKPVSPVPGDTAVAPTGKDSPTARQGSRRVQDA